MLLGIMDHVMTIPDASKKSPCDANASRWGYFLLGLLTALVVFIAGFAAMWAYDAWSGEKPAIFGAIAADKQPVDVHLLDEAWSIIRSDFYGAIPPEKARTYGAIRGSMEALDDPYTYFIEPEPAVREQERLQGNFGGIGAYLTLDDQGRVLLTPMVDRPAAKAGVEKNDILVAIDGVPLPTPADLDQTTTKIRGKVGASVRLTVLRGAEKLDFEVQRAEIELPSVSWRPVEEAPHIGYIRIERFSNLTDKELSQALNELTQQGANQAFIIDLRGDPGGLVAAAVAATGHFLDDGVVLIEKHADGSQKEYKADAGVDVSAETPIILLVDGNTASAAEILAGALQDRKRATLVGEKTYGKGSIQRIHRLSDGSALHVTFAKWFTPNDRAIDGKGLEPDVPVESSPNYDAYLKKALALLRK